MSTPRPLPARSWVYVALAFLTPALVLTGSLASPFLPLLVPALTVLALTTSRRRALWASATVLGILLLWDALTGHLGPFRLGAAGMVATSVAFLAGFWRATQERDRHRLRQLDRILHEAETPPPHSRALDAHVQLAELDRVLGDLARRLQALRIVLWEIDEEIGSIRPQATSSDLPETPIRLHGSPLAWVWRENLTVHLDTAPPWALAGCHLFATCLRGGDTQGSVLTFEFPRSQPAPPAESMEAATSQLRAFLSAQEERLLAKVARRRLDRLTAALRELPLELDPTSLAGALLDTALGLTDATGGAFALWQDDEGRILATAGEDGGPSVGTTFAPLESELALAARGGAVLLREDINRRTRGPALVAPAERWRRRPRVLLAVPLVVDGSARAVLAVWHSSRSRLPDDGVELVRIIAPYAAIQLQQSLTFGSLRENAERDGLTGLYNRRSFDRELAAERARFERYGRPMALLILDIDHFKGINDHYGHEAGDTVLRGVATAIRAGIRDVDFAARFGGEEFVILLPETLLPAATEVAERLRAAIEHIQAPWRGERIPVRASIGVSACPTCVPDPGSLVKSADAMLYQAKQNGRNRVSAAPARLT